MMLQEKVMQIEAFLREVMPPHDQYPSEVHEAMHHAVFSGGKRFRPVLLLETTKACGGEISKALPYAAAIELIHSYSLVHDDLPALDNDSLRRGEPTCHQKYGEAIAILAGDALLTLAFELMAQPQDGASSIHIIKEVSQAIGSKGMVGGQVVDILLQGKEMDQPTTEYVYTHKTGHLIAVSAKIAGMISGTTVPYLENLHRFGEYLGFAFQITDDILDQEGYFKTLGLERAKQEAELFVARAKDELAFLNSRGEKLFKIADSIVERSY
jgi:geranylgeranyl diphosphate synthase, type II